MSQCSVCNYESQNVDDEQLFYQHQCDVYFCCKCLSKSKMEKQIVILPCEHIVSTQEVQIFLNQFCIKCKQIPKEDYYQLLDSSKLCIDCYQLHQNEFTDSFIRCISCQKCIKNTKQSNQQNNQLNICSTCYQDIYQQQVRIKQQKKEINVNKARQTTEDVNNLFNRIIDQQMLTKNESTRKKSLENKQKKQNNQKKQKKQKPYYINQFMCPITLVLMKDPVVASDGFTYERQAITKWLTKSQVSPKTGQKLTHINLTPNNTLKIIIKDYIQRYNLAEQYMQPNERIQTNLYKQEQKQQNRTQISKFFGLFGQQIQLLKNQITKIRGQAYQENQKNKN